MSAYPKLPTRLRGIGGPISVVITKGLNSKTGSECWGLWEHQFRRVQIEQDTPLSHQWWVLFHELTHAALDDSGVSNLVTAEFEEMFCDAIASSRFQQFRGELGIKE